MGRGTTRFLEWIFCIYFVIHVPVSILFDSQGIFPSSWYPEILLAPKAQYTAYLKDALFGHPPVWFQSFIVVETFLQLPFFFVAAYAFYKGNCPWVRIPSIVYSSHVATTVLPILAEFFLADFSDAPILGPSTLRERSVLAAIYAPFFVVPILLLLTMLFNTDYSNPQHKQKSH